MKIETHIITWNSADYIHLTLGYYRTFSDIIVHDNHSTDNTRDICTEFGVAVHLFGAPGVLDDAAYLQVKNNCWKGSDADWVIVVDDDEIFYLDVFPSSDATILHPQGYGMYSNIMPVNSWLQVTTGTQDDNYSKLCCFNPKEITEIGFVYGCHEARPRGNVKIERAGRLLHYRAVGGVDRLIERHRQYCAKQWGQANLKWNLAWHYKQDEDEKRKWFAEQLSKSVPLF